MTFIDIDRLTPKYRLVYSIMLAEKAREFISEYRGLLIIKNILTHCWEWLETQRYCGDDFYEYFDEEIHETGLRIFLERATDIVTENAWDCIIYTVAHVTRKVCEHEGQTTFSESISEYKESFIQNAIESLSQCGNVENYTDELYNLCLKETKIADIQNRFGLYQLNINFSELSEKYKCVLLLMLSDKTLSCIENEEQRNCSARALQTCWEWLHTGKHSGSILMDFIGDEDNGLYCCEITEKEPVVTVALNFVLTTVSFVSRIAFENEGVQDMPKFAAVTTDTVIPYVLDRFKMCYKNANQYIFNVYKICLEERELGYYYQIVKQF